MKKPSYTRGRIKKHVKATEKKKEQNKPKQNKKKINKPKKSRNTYSH